ncbi:5-deoxy-glucuronate isomerase [Acidocella aquatica]|uniref:5-deoxy-glucuronate isomerase n=1 Tax=Acidocella aquatica TaxID=1922313 RepID=A0ABQ6A3V9_9PROT|nr:5-deoxy-glucuronate isomerase [Acidocella aquatica]GLR67131.1 5-deoxy-glucuronate isomerase [Acidocella aquatica]
MSLYLRRAHQPDAQGRCLTAGLPGQRDGLGHIGLEAFALQPGQAVSRSTGRLETGLVLLSGTGLIEAADLHAEIGGRRSPFEGPGHSVYLPPGAAWRFTPASACELALCHAAVPPGAAPPPPRVIMPGAVRCSTRGAGDNERFIRDLLPETEPAAAMLLVEVITPGGHWSSFPPHKHDTAGPDETALEEIYYHRFRRPGGFGFQRIYDHAGLDEALPLTDGAAVLVPRGYHPVSAAPGCDLYYLNIMAGPERRWQISTDPCFAIAR